MDKLYVEYNFPSAQRFYEILKEKGIKHTLKEVKEFIKNQNVAQVHKPIIKNKNKLSSITANEPYEIFQIDLLDYQKYQVGCIGNCFIAGTACEN